MEIWFVRIVLGALIIWLSYRHIFVSLVLGRAIVLTNYVLAGMLLCVFVLVAVESLRWISYVLLGVAAALSLFLLRYGFWIAVRIGREKFLRTSEMVLRGMFFQYGSAEDGFVAQHPHFLRLRCIVLAKNVCVLQVYIPRHSKKLDLFCTSLRKFLTA